MTKHINPFKILALAALIVLPAMSRAAGNEGDAEKKKTISKSYTVSATEKLKIENSFGDVVINTWDKNEFKIDIEMYAKATNDEKAQSILDHIKVTDSRSENTVRFKTDVNVNGNKNDGDDDDDDADDDKDNKDNKNRNKHHSGNNRQFHVNYVVYMPATNPLDINNQFGKVTVPDFKGSVNITSGFGSLKAGKLENVEKIDVQFGSFEIESIQNGKMAFSFDTKSISFINKISGSVKINSDFSHHVRLNITDNITDLSINETYSTLNLIVSKELSASFNAHISFGSFHNATDFKISEAKDDEDNYGPHLDRDYSGVFADGKSKIKIKSSFGTIRLSHTPMTNDDEEKERPEKKERKERKERKEKKETKESEES
jgi:hypothetical protein